MSADEKKRLLLLASVGLGLVVLVQFIIFPVLDYKDASYAKYQRDDARFDRFTRKTAAYSSLVAARKNQAKKFDKGKGALLGAVNGEVGRLKLTVNLASLKPGRNELPSGMKEDSVTLRFNNMYLEQVVRFLHAMQEQHDGVVIKSLSLSRKKGKLLSADVVLAMTMPE